MASQDLSSLQQEISINMSKYLASFTQNSRSKISYSFSVDEPLHYEGDTLETSYQLEINAIEGYKQPVKTNENVAEAYGGHVEKGLYENDYIYVAQGDVTFNATSQINVRQAEPDENKYVFYSDDNIHFNSAPDNASIHSVSIGNKPYLEFGSKPHIILPELSQALMDGINDVFQLTPKSISIKANQTFINPQDLTKLQEVVTLIETSLTNIQANYDEYSLEKILSEDIVKKEEQAEERDALSLKKVQELLEENIYDGVVDNVHLREMSSYVRQIRSPELRQALGTSANSYHYQIEESLEIIKRHIERFDEMTYAKNDELNELTAKIIKVLHTNVTTIIELLEASRKAYASFVV